MALSPLIGGQRNLVDPFSEIEEDYNPTPTHHTSNTISAKESSNNQDEFLREVSRSELEARDYQLDIVAQAKDTNAIVFMDTGTGKTIVSIYLMDYYIKKFQMKKQVQTQSLFFIHLMLS